MAPPQFVVDRESVASSFREWQEEQQRLDAQLAESVSALDAYQANLDNWQQELVHERAELQQLREQMRRAAIAAAGDGSQQAKQLAAELENSRGQIEQLQADLAVARAREKELNEALAAQRHAAENRCNLQHDAFDKAIEHAAAANGQVRAEPRRGANPVLGSVMEQFGKLREQRSLSRSNTKPR